MNGVRRRVRHVTDYVYGAPVTHALHRAWLLPRAHPDHRVLAAEIEIDPPARRRVNELDWFGNRATRFELTDPHDRLTVTASLDMIRAEPRPFDLVPSTGWRRIADALERADAPLDVVEFRHPSPLVPALPQAHSLIRPLLGVDRPTLALLRDLMGLIAAEFVFDPTATSVATPLAEVFATRRGVCQDFAHVAIACLRAAGLAARYHSGYIETLPPPGQPRLVGTDASHAWVGCWCPSLGWIEADPTNALLPAPHMTIAWGRDFADVPPIKGVILGGGHQRLTVSVDVQRVHDDRREEP